MLYLKTLGGLEIRQGGEPVAALESDKTRALLVYLALNPNVPHRRETLAGLFWPEKPEERARHSLSQALYSLRSTLKGSKDLFDITSQTVQLNLKENVWLDAQIFQEKYQLAAFHSPVDPWVCQECFKAPEEGVELYEGEFLAGFNLPGCEAFETWLRNQRESLLLILTKALERLIATLERQGVLERALRYARRLASVDEFNEAAQRKVMRLQTASGLRPEALHQYQAYKERLEEELGVEPEAATTDLYRQIQEGAAGMPPQPKHNLPTPLTQLLGRETELALVEQKLTAPDCRLVTLVGPGGSGKTRLAIEAGSRLLPAFPDGVFIINLDTPENTQNLLATIARHINLELPSSRGISSLSQTSDLRNLLFDHLRLKTILLILDGFEMMLEQAADVSELLHRTTGIKILVTSRARLNLKSEQVIPLNGLASPNAEVPIENLSQFPATRLFLEAAQRAVAGFVLEEAEKKAVIEICQLNQGLPLGILLSAAWAGMLTPSQIARQIRDSLDFLSAGWRDLPERQRSLRATFEYSWRLLTPALQNVLMRLAVFQSVFTAELAWQATDTPLSALKTLNEYSLLSHTKEGGFRLHALQRKFALEKLSASPKEYQIARERHCQVFLQALADWEAGLKSSSQLEILLEIDRCIADIRFAWDWAISQRQFERLQHGAWTLGRYYELRRNFDEGLEAFSAIFKAIPSESLASQNPLLGARAIKWQGIFLNCKSCFSQAQAVFQKGLCQLSTTPLECLDLQAERALLKLYLGSSMLGDDEGDLDLASVLILEGLVEIKNAGNPWDISRALQIAARYHSYFANLEQVQCLTDEAVMLQGAQGDPALINDLEIILGFFYMLSGHYDKGFQCIERQIRYYRQINTHNAQLMALSMQGLMLFHAGRFSEARQYMDEMLHLCSPDTDQVYINFYNYILAIMDVFTGQTAATRQRIQQYGYDSAGRIKPEWNVVTGAQALLEGELDQAEVMFRDYANAMRARHQLKMIGIGLVWCAVCAYKQGDLAGARAYLIAALEDFLAHGYILVLYDAIYLIALIQAEQENLMEAAELFDLVDNFYPEHFSMIETLFGNSIRLHLTALPPVQRVPPQPRSLVEERVALAQHYLERLRNSTDLYSALA